MADIDERAVERAIHALPPGTVLDIRSNTRIDCGVSTRKLTLRLDANTATVAGETGVLAVVNRGRSVEVLRPEQIPCAKQKAWRLEDLRKPRMLIQFISNVAACHRATFTSVATGHTRWAQAGSFMVDEWKLKDMPAHEMAAERIPNLGGESWRYIFACLRPGKSPNLKGLAYLEGYGQGGGLRAGKSFGWTATVRD